ncbi:MAG TPA: hypothetical protein VGD40_18465 [Chryseosolibacter sp.]
MAATPGKKRSFLFGAGALLFCLSSYAQTACSFADLSGEWKEVASIQGQQSNIDSLKELESDSRRALGIWKFNADKTYTHRHPLERSKYKRNGVYTLNESSCEIILGTRPRAQQDANLEVMHLDKDHLIYKSDNNPKGYFTHVLVRLK